jgi:hypothetical protein
MVHNNDSEKVRLMMQRAERQDFDGTHGKRKTGKPKGNCAPDDMLGPRTRISQGIRTGRH